MEGVQTVKLRNSPEGMCLKSVVGGDKEGAVEPQAQSTEDIV